MVFLVAGLAHSGTAEDAPPGPVAAMVVDLVDGMAARVGRDGLNETLRTSTVGDWTRSGAGLYIFVFETNGLLRAHPNRGMLGHDIIATKDADGRLFIRDIIAALPESGATTWISYTWWDPKEQRVRRKNTYARRVGLMILACGFYADEA